MTVSGAATSTPDESPSSTAPSILTGPIVDRMDVIAAARTVATDVLGTAAADVDAGDTIPAGHLHALADAGMFGLAHPDAGIDDATRRTVTRHLAAACGATCFVWAQHAGTLARLASTPNTGLRDRWLERCTSGEVLAGTAFAHLRRAGAPTLTARRMAEGWRLDGLVPWATSWGLAGVFSIAARTEDGQIVWAAIEGREREGLGATAPLELSVMRATRTVELVFDGALIGEDEVLSVERFDDWHGPDRRKAARVNPAVLGVVDAALASIGGREVPGAPETLAALRAQLERWEADDADQVADGAGPDQLATHRAALLDLAGRATTAAIALAGGNAMLQAHATQRLARERLFYVVQAQSGDGRRATLERLRP